MIVLVWMLSVLTAVSTLSVAVLGCTKKKKVVEYNINEDSDMKEIEKVKTKNEEKDKNENKEDNKQSTKPEQDGPGKSAYYGQQSTAATEGQSHYYDSTVHPRHPKEEEVHSQLSLTRHKEQTNDCDFIIITHHTLLFNYYLSILLVTIFFITILFLLSIIIYQYYLLP